MATAEAGASEVQEMNVSLGEWCLEACCPVAVQDNVGKYVSQRPAEGKRLFRSDAVERKIKEIKAKLRIFENCFPNTLDTTVHFRELDGKPDTFIYTGDIHAMWLRDSGAQVWLYVQLANEDRS